MAIEPRAQSRHHPYHHPSPEATEGHLKELFAEEEQGYHKGLKPRQIQMIAIGGAIGTGLFMGAGGRLASAGPVLVFVYAFCGIFTFFVLRALGELVLHRPSSGSFVSYAREFFGEKAAFAAGWFYFIYWGMTSIGDVTAVALYMNFFKKYWEPIANVPQWVFALGALVVVLGLNLLSVKVFGELEFWFALIKVVALVSFLVVGVIFVVFGTPVDGQQVGFSLIQDNGGWLPNGLLPAILLVQGVVFAYGGVERGVAWHRSRGDRASGEGHSTSHQYRYCAACRVLCGVRPAAEPAIAIHRLSGRHQPVCDVLRIDRLGWS